VDNIEIIKTAHGICVRIKDFHAILIPFSFWEEIKAYVIWEFLEKKLSKYPKKKCEECVIIDIDDDCLNCSTHTDIEGWLKELKKD